MADTIDSVPVSADAVAGTTIPKAATDDLMSALNQQADQARRYYEKLAKQIKQAAVSAAASSGDTKMADFTPTIPMTMAGGGSGDGMFGAGGGGLIGGLILGSLLRNNGNLFGGGDGAVGGAVLRNPPEQNQANMDLMAGIGQVDKAVAVGTAAMEGSQAAQSAAINASLNSVASSLVTRIDSTKEAVNSNAMVLAQQLNQLNTNLMATANETQKVVTNDGDKTRALITAQYEANLQRQLSDANAALIELRSREFAGTTARGVEVNTTNNINQMQQQQQQQAQFAQLGNLILGLGQAIRSTNEAINVGSGTLTANPINTNTNIR